MDDSLYNKYLSEVTDLAYCLCFTDDMIRDWCRAVAFVMEGHKLSADCGLQCESEAGKQFFLHQDM